MVAPRNWSGEAMTGQRDDIFLVRKVLPSHATEEGNDRRVPGESAPGFDADRLDLYLRHWAGPSAASADRRRLWRLRAARLIRI